MTVAPHLLEEEGDVITESGLFGFAVLALERAGLPAEIYLDLGFTFSVCGDRPRGGYLRAGDAPERWLTPDFTAWLKMTAEAAPDWEGWAASLPRSSELMSWIPFVCPLTWDMQTADSGGV